MSRFLRCQPPSLAPCSTALLLHFVAAKLCNVSVTAFGAHPVPPPWACGHWAPCPSPTVHSSFSVVVLSLHSVVIRHFILFCTFYYGSRLPHTFFIIMSAYQHVANILHGHRWWRSASQSQHLAPAGLGPSEALKCAFRAARWAASLHSSLIVWMMTTTTTAMPASSVQSP